jgi:hypothetical protein
VDLGFACGVDQDHVGQGATANEYVRRLRLFDWRGGDRRRFNRLRLFGGCLFRLRDEERFLQRLDDDFADFLIKMHAWFLSLLIHYLTNREFVQRTAST